MSIMEANSDGDVAEQIFNDTVREYVVSFKLSVFLCFVKILSTNDRRGNNEKTSTIVAYRIKSMTVSLIYLNQNLC